MEKRRLLSMSVGIIAALLFLSTTVFAANEKIGYIDVSTAFDKYEKTIDSDKQLEATRLEKKEKRDAIVADVKRLKDELELMNESGREEKQAEIDKKISALHEFERSSREDLRRQRDTMVREILREMDAVITDYGQKEGYSLILDDRAILYKNETLDLTDQVIEILNTQYKKR